MQPRPMGKTLGPVLPSGVDRRGERLVVASRWVMGCPCYTTLGSSATSRRTQGRKISLFPCVLAPLRSLLRRFDSDEEDLPQRSHDVRVPGEEVLPRELRLLAEL